MPDPTRPTIGSFVRVSLVLAPALALASELSVPRDETTNSADELAFISTHSTGFLVADLLAFAAAALFAAGLCGLVATALPRARTAVKVGAVMAILGAFALIAHPMLLLALRDLAVTANPAAMAPADDTMSEGVAAMVILALRLFGFDLGLAVLTVALWRARVLPAWAAPVGFLALVADFSPTSYNAVIMNAVLVAGFAVAAWHTRPVPLPAAVPQPAETQLAQTHGLD